MQKTQNFIPSKQYYPENGEPLPHEGPGVPEPRPEQYHKD